MAKKLIKSREIIEAPRMSRENRETVRGRPPEMEARIEENLLAASCKTLVGSDVVNPRGDDLGKIDDMMIDLQEKTVAYAILKTGTFLGMGGKLLPIPLQALSVESPPGSKETRFVLNIPKETLEKAEGYDAGQLPLKVDYRRLGDIYSEFGSEPYWGQHPGEPM